MSKTALLKWCDFLQTAFFTISVAIFGVIGYVFANYKSLSNADLFICATACVALIILEAATYLKLLKHLKSIKD